MGARHEDWKTAWGRPCYRQRGLGSGDMDVGEDAEGLGPFQLDTIVQMDCIEGMRQMPPNSVDVAIADPPYNASKGGEWTWDNSVKLPGFGGDWTKIRASWDDMPLADYVAFTSAWLAELKRIVKPSGSMWVHGTYHNIGIINFVLQLLEIEIINEVVWYKRNSFPNLSGRRLTASHETILWAHTGKRREYYFDYELAKAMDCPEDGLKPTGKQMRTVWDIPNNKDRSELAHGKHPAQKPVRLLKRMLQLSARPGGTVLVPFCGSGSECVAAQELGLHYLGFETDETFAELSRQRTAETDTGQLALLSSDDSQPARMLAKRTGLTSASSQVKPRIPSLIKWTGSKRSQAAEIASLAPEYSRYYEPFVGGGAVLYLLGRPGAVAGDTYTPLVELWKLVQEEPDQVIEDYARQWSALQRDLPDYFYRVRERYNSSWSPLDLSFLMRTCVNGIMRINAAGEFNNSFHLSRKGMEPKRFAKVVDRWHEVVAGVEFRSGDFAETLVDAKAGDFAYLDPPYAGNKQRYSESLDSARLFDVLADLNRRDVKWALSYDGWRGDADLTMPVPKDLYVRNLRLETGHSAVGKVLSKGLLQVVAESLYLNY